MLKETGKLVFRAAGVKREVESTYHCAAHVQELWFNQPPATLAPLLVPLHLFQWKRQVAENGACISWPGHIATMSVFCLNSTQEASAYEIIDNVPERIAGILARTSGLLVSGSDGVWARALGGRSILGCPSVKGCGSYKWANQISWTLASLLPEYFGFSRGGDVTDRSPFTFYDLYL